MNKHFPEEEVQMANKHMGKCSTSLTIRKCKLKQYYNSILHRKEWQLSKNLKITNAGVSTV